MSNFPRKSFMKGGDRGNLIVAELVPGTKVAGNDALRRLAVRTVRRGLNPVAQGVDFSSRQYFRQSVLA